VPVLRHAIGAVLGGVLLLGGANAAEARERSRTDVMPGDVWLPFGVLGSVSSHLGGQDFIGIGGEVSLVQYGGDEWMGAFLQGQALGWLNNLDLDRDWHPRFAAGFEGGWRFVGIEFGAAVEGGYSDGEETYATTLMLHAAPVLTLGIVSVSMRDGVPLFALGSVGDRGSEGDMLPLELGGAFTLKIPLRLTD
jgi:hypothetical protein